MYELPSCFFSKFRQNQNNFLDRLIKSVDDTGNKYKKNFIFCWVDVYTHGYNDFLKLCSFLGVAS